MPHCAGAGVGRKLAQGVDSPSVGGVRSAAFARRGDERMQTPTTIEYPKTRRSTAAAAGRPCFALAATEALEARARH